MANTVGRFTWNGEVVAGPAEYMKAKGCALIAAIEKGEDKIFNMTVGFSPDPVTAVLVRLQTDYAAWLGGMTFEAFRSAR